MAEKLRNSAMKHLLINSHIRSGGSLLARLFDSHSSCMTFPLEMRYAKKKVFWPNISKHLDDRNLDKIIDLVDLEWSFQKSFRNVNSQKIISKDLYGRKTLDFSYKQFIQTLTEILSSQEKWTHEKVVNAIGNAFFSVWEQGAHYIDNAEWLVNHMSMMCFADPEYFFDTFESGIIIQTVRSPWDWYASMQKHFKTTRTNELFFKYSLHLWRESTIRGIQHSRTFDNYKLIRYEDLVLSPENTLEKIAGYLGISSLSKTPTIGGSLWMGNSSFGSKQSMDSRSIFTGKDFLSPEQRQYISDNYGDLAGSLGYSEDSLTEIPVCSLYSDKLLLTDVLLDPLEENKRLKMMNIRLSSMLFSFHRDLVGEIKKQ